MKYAAIYLNGERHGTLWGWNEFGDLVFAANYVRDRLDCYCCAFADGELRLVLEYDNGRLANVHEISGSTVTRSFASDMDMLAEDRILFELWKEALNEIEHDENDIKREVREKAGKITYAQRQQLAAARNQFLSGLIQARENQRRMMNQQHIDGLRRQSFIE
jgi:hypothetical protein